MPDNPAPTPGSAEPTLPPETGTTTTTEPTAAPPSTTSTPIDDKSVINQDARSLANQAPQGTGAPESYAPFNVPDGYELDQEVAKEIGGMFKADNLSQEQAQKYVDWYVSKTNEIINAPYDVWRQTQQDWQ